MNNIRYWLLFFTGICLFYAGTQVNNPTLTYGNWTLLKDLSSILSSIATVLGVTFAYGAYNSWKKQITHHKQFDGDRDAYQNLKAIHRKIEDFSRNKTPIILWAYQDAIALANSGNSQVARLTLRDMRRELSTSQIDRVYFEFRSKVEHVMISDFGSDEDLPECILSYRTYLKDYILFCSKCIHSSMHNTPIDTVIPNTPYRIEELLDDGHLYTRIEHEFDNIRLYFKHKWEL